MRCALVKSVHWPRGFRWYSCCASCAGVRGDVKNNLVLTIYPSYRNYITLFWTVGANIDLAQVRARLLGEEECPSIGS